MKRNIKKLAIVLVLAIAAFLNPEQSSAQQNRVSFQIFYDALSPYGQWVDYQNYGYVWIPDVGPEFAPYSTDGYWVNTDYGWTWVSDYEWGWAPFHYGRWSYDNYYGWLWVPGNEWGPSWVNWRMADGYYGWSPMEPGISITLSFGRPYNSYNDHWNFVRARDFESRDIYRYFVDRSDHARIIRNSTVINTTYIDNSRHTTYVTGPAREDVQRVTGRRISPVAIQENSRPGRILNDGNIKMYRPQIEKNSRLGQKPQPVRVENIKNVKRPSERTGFSQPAEMNHKNNFDNKPTQQQGVNPVDNNGRQQQQNAKPQNNIEQQRNQQQRQQLQNKTPVDNGERQQQQITKPQNNNEQQKNQQVKPVQQQRQQQQQQQRQQQQQQQQQQQRQQQQQQQRQQQPQQQPPQPQQQQPQQQPQQQQPQPQPQPATPANNNQNQQQNLQKQRNQQIKEQVKEKKSVEEIKPNN